MYNALYNTGCFDVGNSWLYRRHYYPVQFSFSFVLIP